MVPLPVQTATSVPHIVNCRSEGSVRGQLALQMDHPNHGGEENDHPGGMCMAPLTVVAEL